MDGRPDGRLVGGCVGRYVEIWLNGWMDEINKLTCPYQCLIFDACRHPSLYHCLSVLHSIDRMSRTYAYL
jgi:hypothetical protein